MSEILVSCPDCGTPNFTPRGLASHRGGTACKKRQAEAVAVIAPALTDSEKIAVRDTIAAIKMVDGGLKRAVYGALVAGMGLAWLHERAVSRGVRNSGDGFKAVLEETGVNRSTAYRWMNAFAGTGLSIHQPDSEQWHATIASLKEISESTSLRRLTLGAAAENSDERRMDSLISREEQGDAAAAEALDKVSSGEWSLVQAVRAASGAAATKEKNRRDPIYLDLGAGDGGLIGLAPKAVVTLANAFARWDDVPPAAREKFRAAWTELVANLPPDFRR